MQWVGIAGVGRWNGGRASNDSLELVGMDNSALKVGSCEIRVLKSGRAWADYSFEDGTRHYGVIKHSCFNARGVTQVGFDEFCPLECGVLQFGMCKDCPSDISIIEIGSPQVGFGKIHVDEIALFETRFADDRFFQ